MDLSPFRPGYDAAGKRARSLELYGLATTFRTSDGFGAELDEIVRCVARFAGATGASVDVWPGADPVTLAAVNLVAPGPTTPPAPVVPVLRRAWDLAADTGEPFEVRAGPPESPDLTCWAVSLVGQEHVPVGLLTAWHHGAWEPTAEQRRLVRHLAGAVVGVLDRQRRVRQRRSRPGGPSLRAVDAPERRRGGG